MELSAIVERRDYNYLDGEFEFPLRNTIRILNYIQDFESFTIYDEDVKKYLIYKKIIRNTPNGMQQVRNLTRLRNLLETLKGLYGSS